MDRQKPFDKQFVVRLTVANMRKDIDISINKTTGRLEDFEADSDKWREVLDTIHVLNKLKALLDEFQINNEQLFSKEEN